MLNAERLAAEVEAGTVKATRRRGLTIYNYTDRCVYDRAWNPTTSAARGAILADGGAIVARPFPKFFNLNETPQTQARQLACMGSVPELADKMDGSLLIVFRDPETDATDCCTRGSWDNPQTAWARGWLARTGYNVPHGETHLFELIAPWNRIVLPYEREDMVLLSVVRNDTGEDTSYAETARIAAERGVTGVRSIVADVSSVDLSDPSVRDREGYVARWSSGFRVKLKFAHYLTLHRILTGLSAKGVWEMLSRGEDPKFDGVPDEFLAWYRGIASDLRSKFAERSAAVNAAFASQDWASRSRGDVAREWAKMPPDVRACLFKRLDGRPFDDIIWKSIRPEGVATFQRADG